MRLLDHGKQQHRIRLSGMDAPEKGQALGRRSKKSLSRLAFGKDARGDCHTRDRYDRNVCRAFVDKLDLSAARVELGMAWSFRTYANEQEAQARLLYEELEERARAVGTGLWAEKNPVPPRQWRSAHANRLRVASREVVYESWFS